MPRSTCSCRLQKRTHTVAQRLQTGRYRTRPRGDRLATVVRTSGRVEFARQRPYRPEKAAFLMSRHDPCHGGGRARPTRRGWRSIRPAQLQLFLGGPPRRCREALRGTAGGTRNGRQPASPLQGIDPAIFSTATRFETGVTFEIAPVPTARLAEQCPSATRRQRSGTRACPLVSATVSEPHDLFATTFSSLGLPAARGLDGAVCSSTVSVAYRLCSGRGRPAGGAACGGFVPSASSPATMTSKVVRVAANSFLLIVRGLVFPRSPRAPRARL